MNPLQVINESRPMLEDVLSTVGIHRAGELLNLRATLEPFSHWIETQEVTTDDVAFLAGLIGAFICEFLIEHHGAVRTIRGERIYLQLPSGDGVWKEFEPYAVAFGMAQSRNSLSAFLRDLTKPSSRA